MPSVTRKAGRTQLRRAEIEGRTFAAVERLLTAGESYTSLGVQRICDEAGVARSSFYSVFGDKTELILRLAGQATEAIFAGSEQFFATAGAVRAADLTATQTTSIRVFREHAALISALAELSTYDAGVADFWRDRLDRVVATTAAWIAREQQAGRIRAGLDPKVAARFVVQGAEGCMLHQATHEAARTDAKAAAALSELVLTMFYGTWTQ